MIDSDIRTLIGLRMAQAREVLGDARIVLDAGGSGRTVVNRAYYGAFYAVLALLQIVGKTPRGHHGAIVLFGEHYVKTMLLPRDAADDLHFLFESRQEDDYRRTEPVTKEDAELALERAERFCETVRQYLASKDLLDL